MNPLNPNYYSMLIIEVPIRIKVIGGITIKPIMFAVNHDFSEGGLLLSGEAGLGLSGIGEVNLAATGSRGTFVDLLGVDANGTVGGCLAICLGLTRDFGGQSHTLYTGGGAGGDASVNISVTDYWLYLGPNHWAFKIPLPIDHPLFTRPIAQGEWQ